MEVTDKEVDDVLEEIEKRDWKPELADGEDLRTKVKENIGFEKEFRNKEKKRISVIEALVKETKMDVPKVLVDSELAKMLGQFKDDVQKAGMKWETYLESIKKTEGEILEEWKEKALERSKAECIVAKISENEKLDPELDEVEKESTHLLEHHPDADPLNVRIYVFTQLRNQKVFEFLESQK